MKVEESSFHSNNSKLKNIKSPKENKKCSSSPRRSSTPNVEKNHERTYIKKVFYKDPARPVVKKQNIAALSKSTNEFKKVKNRDTIFVNVHLKIEHYLSSKTFHLLPTHLVKGKRGGIGKSERIFISVIFLSI